MTTERNTPTVSARTERNGRVSLQPASVRTRRPRGVPKPTRRELVVFPLVKTTLGLDPSQRERPSTLVLPFELSKPSPVSITLRSPTAEVHDTLSVRGKPGVNRTTLPARFSDALTERGGTIEVAIAGKSGEGVLGVVDLPGERAHTGFGTATLRTLGHFASKIVSLAGYWAANDGWQHVIVATEDGRVTELFFNPNEPNFVGVARSPLARFWNPIVGVAAYYADDDHYQHVFVALGPGTVFSESVFEFRWDPSIPKYKLAIEWFASHRGIAGIAAFGAPNIGWINGWPNAPAVYQHFVFLTGPPRSTDKLFFLSSASSHHAYRVIQFIPKGEPKTFDSPPPPAAFYSASQRALSFVGLTDAWPALILGEFIPLDYWQQSTGDVVIGKYRHGPDLARLERPGKIAAFSPDEIIVTDPRFPGDVFEFSPDPNRTSPMCDTRFDSRSYLGPRLGFPSISWCTSRLAHLDNAEIVALAGYTAPKTWQGPGACHAIVATDEGEVVDIAFKPS